MISIKRLTRGIKLLLEHVYTPINAVLESIFKGRIPLDQYEKQDGTFRVSFYVPFTRHSGIGIDRSTDFAFVLPPLQDEWGLDTDLVNQYRLIEISVGQDTRAEPGTVHGPKNLAAMPAYGTLDGGNMPSYRLALLEKEIAKSENNPVNNELYSMDVPAVALTNPYERFNPVSQSGLSVAMRTDRSYLVRVFTEYPGPNALGTSNLGQMTSLFVTLKLSTELTTRDQAASAQNATSTIDVTSHIVSANVPAKNTPIEADSATGVNTAFKIIDQVVDSKMIGGLTREGDLHGYKENLQADACYDVISVPIFPGWGSVRGGAVTDHLGCQEPSDMPWSAAGAGNFVTMDRAIIPLQHPISIHHVVLGVNYKAPPIGAAFDFTVRPSTLLNATLTHDVGVGLITGMRADSLATQQVASVSWTPATRANYLIDTMDFRTNLTETYGYSWDLMSCPLVGYGSASGNGKGYYNQGKPVYAIAGQEQASQTRTTIAGAASLTGGAEQALDIRWKISDAVSDPALWANKATIVGYRGFWVYLICKKLLR